MRKVALLALVLTAAAFNAVAQETRPPAEGQEAAAPAAPQAAPRPDPAVAFRALLERVEAAAEAEAQVSATRERAANAALERQEGLAREALTRRNTAENRGIELNRRWENNDVRTVELRERRTQKEGNLGELFGVTRQVAGDSANVLQQSLLSIQYPAVNGEERSEFMRRLADASELPSIEELERLWFELLREMTDSGKVARLETGIIQADGSVVPGQVVRVGPFAVSADGRYLGYIPSSKQLTVLNGDLPASYQSVGQRLQESSAGGYVKAVADPARGALVGLYLERPDWLERIEDGEVVGYVIIAVGALGFLCALYQYGYLFFMRFAVLRQLRTPESPSPSNPLGRIYLASRMKIRESRELRELRLAEAVLKEVPPLERFQAFLRLAVAAGPLLGLVGTVIGMILTFKAITASGTSDPKLMAHGIGQAMIATVLGLGIAIPLLFVNAGLTALSRGITRILDEQSQALAAEDPEAAKG